MQGQAKAGIAASARSEETIILIVLAEITDQGIVVDDLTKRYIGLKVLTREGAPIDTTSANGQLTFGIFADLARV